MYVAHFDMEMANVWPSEQNFGRRRKDLDYWSIEIKDEKSYSQEFMFTMKKDLDGIIL